MAPPPQPESGATAAAVEINCKQQSLRALEAALSGVLLLELIGMTAEYTFVHSAQFDERCLDAPVFDAKEQHRLTHPLSAGSPITTIALVRSERFVWIVAKETFVQSGLRRWSLRIDDNAGDMSVAFGVSTLTVAQARKLSSTCPADGTVEGADGTDRTGLWWIQGLAHLRNGGTALTPRCWLPPPCKARAAALSLAERKELTPMRHFVGAGVGDAGLELHFDIDLNARTLRLQLNHPPDASVAAVVVDWDQARWSTHARATRLTPSEVLTVRLPPESADAYRPALMLRGPMTVSEIEPPAVFPLTA
jgi:hypothetical protein